MKVIDWIRRKTTVRGKALSYYERGMAKANKHDQDGAIDDYTKAIELPGSPTDVVSMAMFNRALVQVAAGEHTKGMDDLTKVIRMDGAPDSVIQRAKQKLAKRESQDRNRSK